MAKTTKQQIIEILRDKNNKNWEKWANAYNKKIGYEKDYVEYLADQILAVFGAEQKEPQRANYTFKDMKEIIKQIITGILIGVGSWIFAMGAMLVIIMVLWLLGVIKTADLL